MGNPKRTDSANPQIVTNRANAVSHRWSAKILNEGGLSVTVDTMAGTLIGYARCSTDEQDLTAQRDVLEALGVPPRQIYLDHGLTGTNRKRPGLDQALAAVRAGDTFVVPKLDRVLKRTAAKSG